MMMGGDADLKPLVMSCLEDDPELRPSATDISEVEDDERTVQ